jgi:hypothetical protein
MQNHLNMAEYARRCGVSRVTIFKKVKAGILIKSERGIDPDLPTNREYEERCKMRLSAASEPKEVQQPAKKKPKPKSKSKNGNGNGSLDSNSNGNGQLNLELVDRNEAERLKIIEQVLNYQIKTQKDRQELVERALVKRVFAKLYAVDTAELHPLGEKIGADLAAFFGHDDSEAKLKSKQLIDKHVFNALQHIKRLMDDFLKSVGEGEV